VSSKDFWAAFVAGVVVLLLALAGAAALGIDLWHRS
jgi:hypothetical protein